MSETGILKSLLPKREPGLAAETRTLWEYVDARISQVISHLGDRDLAIDGSTHEKLTFSRFRALVQKTAFLFQRRYGVKEGSVVILCSKNSLYFFVPLFAASALGATVFSIPAYSHDNIPFCVATEADLPLIICDTNILPQVRKYAENVFVEGKSSGPSAATNTKPQIVLLEGEALSGHESIVSLITTDEDDGNGNFCAVGMPELPKISPKEEAVVFFSSGSTGPPKPIVHSHENLLSLSYNTGKLFSEEEAGEVKVVNMNHAHIGGFFFFFGAISSGSTVVTFSNFKPELLLETIHRYQPSSIAMYPKDATFVAKQSHDERLQLSCVKEIGVGAAMFPNSITEALKEKFSGLKPPLHQIYGSTEILLVATTFSISGVSEKEAGVGHIMPYTEMKIVDLSTGASLGPYECGEVWFRSPFRLLGYRNRPDLDAEAITPDGWYKMGDYGYYDAEERLHIVDRVKDLILTTSGKLVSPSAIDDIILRHPDVAQVGVAGIPHPDGRTRGFLPRAFVIPKPGARLTQEDIVDFVKGQAKDSEMHLTGGAELIDDMVTSPGGKVYRSKLREDYLKRVRGTNPC